MADPRENPRCAYGDNQYHREGEQCSSTNEGRYVRIYEDELIHPAHADGLVDNGDPCLTFGYSLVGVAMNGASSTDDIVILDTEGIWWFTVYAEVDDIDVGQMLYIDGATCQISDDWMDMIPFGHALGPVTYEQSSLIPVKVHAYQWSWFLLP